MNNMNDPAEIIFGFLYQKEPAIQADIIIGFGHFDPKIPVRCGELYQAGMASQLIFTGGIGAGTADLGEPEALYFKKVLQQQFPAIPLSAVITETKSTNTGENIRFVTTLLQQQYPQLVFGKGVQKALIVANAYRQRRVYHTCQLYFPQLSWINCPPDTDYLTEKQMFAAKGENLDIHLLGELERLQSYPAKGFISPVSIPDQILKAYMSLKKYLQ
jgi:uncharacterized SAM-binding protein YcdF (DUF218 family)